jgi:hypothetical protein
MGQPGWWRHQSSGVSQKRTQGTETSQYLEEEKSIEMPQVAASERGSSLNRFSLRGGVVGPTDGMQSCQWKSPGTGRQRR